MSQATEITALAYELAEVHAISLLEGHSAGRGVAKSKPGEVVELAVFKDWLEEARKSLRFLQMIHWLTFTEHPHGSGGWTTIKITRTQEPARVPATAPQPYEPDGL